MSLERSLRSGEIDEYYKIPTNVLDDIANQAFEDLSIAEGFQDPNFHQFGVPNKDNENQAHGIPTLEHLMKNLLHVDEVIKLIEDEETKEATELDGDSEEEEEVYGVCHVCLKDKEHSTFECPYLDCITDPENTTVGEDYFIVCKECGKLGGHPERDWERRAMGKPIEFMTDYKPDGYDELMKQRPVKYASFFERGELCFLIENLDGLRVSCIRMISCVFF